MDGLAGAVMGAEVAAVCGKDALLCVRRPSQCGTYGPGAAAVAGSTDHSGRHGSGSVAGADHHQAGQRRTAQHDACPARRSPRLPVRHQATRPAAGRARSGDRPLPGRCAANRSLPRCAAIGRRASACYRTLRGTPQRSVPLSLRCSAGSGQGLRVAPPCQTPCSTAARADRPPFHATT